MNSPQHVPRATYRLQLHRGFTLRRALSLVPYLDALGVSHLYLSPLLQARPGSPHGYDVCDPSRLNPELGTQTDLETLVSTLRRRGMGLVLDIVPNHLAAAPENPWWWDLLQHGPQSRFADYWDIDWNPPEPWLRGKVLLPVLNDDYARVLARGELTVTCQNAEVTVRYLHHRFPVTPASLRAPGQSLDTIVASCNADRQTLDHFLDRQHYRLANWRQADHRLNYRRFFTVTELAGVRVELPQVFTDTHNLILDWHQRHLLDGLRVDHPDGLRAPCDYLQRLNHSAPRTWMVVEKILEPDESLPPDWPVAGTTGYDFLHRVGGLFVHPHGERPITRHYAAFTGEPTDYPALVRQKKRRILQQHLATEVDRLVRVLRTIIARRALKPEAHPNELRDTLVEVIASFPVYRTYTRPETGLLSPADRSHVSRALAAARCLQPPPSPPALRLLSDLLQLRLRGNLETDFVLRFQQLTGPAMAKGVEDTAFYCFNRFGALNEVGGNPARFGSTLAAFHRACRHTRRRWPDTMLTTSTHDTKRSEDVRARLALLSEIPERWAAAVRRWSSRNEPCRRQGLPHRNAEYLFYETLVGAWPLSADRAVAYLLKAAREAKQHTHWTNPNPRYEEALTAFVRRTLADPRFVADVERFVTPLLPAGYRNSLAQTLLKLTAPGVPDLYQGTELWDLSLVDPDNRRPVHFSLRRRHLAELRRRQKTLGRRQFLEELLRQPDNGRIKSFLIRETLQFRREHANLFRHGRYHALPAVGPQADHVCAFARILKPAATVTVVPRWILTLAPRHRGLSLPHAFGSDTRLVLPRTLAGRPWRNLFTGEILSPQRAGGRFTLGLGDVLNRFPVALLATPEPPVPIQPCNHPKP